MSWVFAGLHIFIIVLKLRKLELPFNQPRGGFLCGSAGKESSCNAGNLGSIPGLGRSPGEGKGYQNTPVFWPREFHGLYAKNWTRLSDFHFTLTKLRKEAPTFIQSLSLAWLAGPSDPSHLAKSSAGTCSCRCGLWLSSLLSSDHL